VLYGCALWTTKNDPRMLQILLHSGLSHSRYDAAKRDHTVVRIGRPRW
jgi:hypothetical protein